MTSVILTASLVTKATGRHDRFHYAGSPGAGSGCNVLVQGSPSDGKAANSGRSLATPLGPESAPSETRADHSMTTALDPKRKVPRRSTIGWFRALCGPPVDPMDGGFERGAIVSNRFFSDSGRFCPRESGWLDDMSALRGFGARIAGGDPGARMYGAFQHAAVRDKTPARES